MISRVGIALVLGALGFITGALAVWMLTDLPGVSISNTVAFWAACATGGVCLVTGFVYSDKTIDALGEVWQVAWQISVGILATLRALIR
jgi:enoyl-CoA hydratase/carnithine racemase